MTVSFDMATVLSAKSGWDKLFEEIIRWNSDR